MTWRKLGVMLIVGGIFSPAFLGSSAARGESYGTRARPLSGRRFETMRALAHYLDERAQHAVEQAASLAPRSQEERKLRDSINEFAQRAHDLHERMDGYLDDPWELPPEIVEMADLAQRLDTRIRPAPALGRMSEDWKAVLDVLHLMREVLAGHEVRVPRAHPGFSDYDRDYGPFNGRGGGGGRDGDGGRDGGGSGGEWRAQTLERMRGMASDLEETAGRAQDNAEEVRQEYSGYKTQLDDLRQINRQAQDLRRRIDDEEIAPREAREMVDQMLQRARHTDQMVRRYEVYREAWDDLTETISLLDRMARLLR